MKIMVKPNGQTRWQKVEERAFEQEKNLQELLADNLDLIPVEMLGDERKPFCVSLREAGLPGSGRTDLIGIDEDGNIAVIEAKLASNQDIKRKVIGQILEYAAFLWKKPYEEFDRLVRSRLGQSLLELMQAVPKDDEEWSPEDFQRKITDNLKEGRFALFIVVDEINDELRRTIDFLNSKDVGDLHLFALELKHYQTNVGQVVLPQMYGTDEGPEPDPGDAWDEARFLGRSEKTLQDDPDKLSLLRQVYEFLKETYEPHWGTGKDSGRVAFRLRDANAKDGFITVLRLKTDGTVKLGFGRLLKEAGPERSVELARALLEDIGVPAFSRWANETYFIDGKTLKRGWPGAGRLLTDLFPDPQSVQQLKGGLAAFARRIIQ
jgi:hypothetical protein